MIEYKGEIIEYLGKGYWWNGFPFDSLEEVKLCIDDFINCEK